MLDAFGELMPDRYKKRRVSAIRDFPKGCGRNAPPLDVKPLRQQAPALPLSPPPLSTPLAEPDSGKLSGTEVPVADGVSKSNLLSEKVTNAQPTDLAGVLESSRPEAAVSSVEVEGADRMEGTGSLKGTFPPDNMNGESGEVKDLDSVVNLESSHILKESFGRAELLALLESDGYGACSSKLYGPPKRRMVSAIREFPTGCGRNAALMIREECLRVAAAASNNKSLVADKKSNGEQKPAAEGTEGKPKRSDAEEVRDRVEEINGGGLAESVSPSQLNGGKKVLAEVASSRIQEGVQGNVGYVVANSASQSNLNEMFAEEKIGEKILAVVAPETSCKGVRGHEAEENNSLFKAFLKVNKAGLKGNVTEEHIEKKALTKVASGSKLEGSDTKQADRKSTSRETQDLRPSRLDAKSQPHSRSKAAEKEASGPARKHVGMKRGRDIKSLKWKLLEADEEDGALDLQYQGKEDVALEVRADRLIVQALMASPNCPWSQGKRTGMTAFRAAMSGEKAKKGGITSAKKRASSGFPASHFQNREVAEGSQDSVPHDGDDEHAIVLYQGSHELSVNTTPFGPSDSRRREGDSEEAATRTEVRKALRLFQVICRKLLQGEESRSKGAGRGYRVDLKAANILKEKDACVNTGKPILGPVPGVEVGDEFHFRVELSVIGLHRPYQAGIDYMNRGGMSIAVSIVASEGHADDMDNSEVLIYSGSGGSAAEGDKPAEDQKLERGNLSLKNCIEAKTPVRVIRGFKELKLNDPQDARAKPFSTFTYDGLYIVEGYWQEEGSQGFNIYKFQLRRLPGQPEIALKQVKSLKKSMVREGLCIIDISEGKEKMPISVVNTIDDDRPAPFKYITKMMHPSWYDMTSPKGCDCTDGCSDSENCACAVKNGGEIPFNFNGAIVQAKPLVYECGPSCECPPSCHNRVSQHGIKIQLEIFKTKLMGWGVRSLTSIPSGSFICEYTGELLNDKEAEQRNNDEYLFDIGHNYDDKSLWEGLPALLPDLQSSGPCEAVENGGVTVDAAEHGNVGRFINNSCSPNLYAQNVLYDHDDRRIPHVMFFAAENIPPLQELTYYYNYTIGQVRDSEGNMKRKDCYCGSHECVGRLY